MSESEIEDQHTSQGYREQLIKRVVDNVKCPNPDCRVAAGTPCINSNREVCSSRIREAKKRHIII